MLRALKAIGPFFNITVGLVLAATAGLILFQMRTTSARPWLDVALGLGVFASGLFFLSNAPVNRALVTLGVSTFLALAFLVFSFGLDYFKRLPDQRFRGRHGFKTDSYVRLERSARDGRWAVRSLRFRDFTQREPLADRVITEPEFSGAQIIADDGPLRVTLNGKDNCIDGYGKPYFAWRYDQILECRPENQTVIVKAGGTYSLVKMDGRPVRDLQFDEIEYSSDYTLSVRTTSMFKARRGKKWGFVDRTTGEETVALLYEDAHEMRNGHAPVKLNGQWGVIDSAGRSVVYPQFVDVRLFYGGGSPETNEGIWAIQNGAWGLYDMVDKRWIITPQLPYAFIFASLDMSGPEAGQIRKTQAVWTYNGEPILSSDRWEALGPVSLRRKSR